MQLDRKFRVMRPVETGRDALNEPILELQQIASGWCGEVPLSRERYEALGLSGDLEAVGLVIRRSTVLRGLRSTDLIELDGLFYSVKALQARAGPRRGFLEIAALREVHDG